MKFATVCRSIYAVLLSLVVAHTASAASVLNFVKSTVDDHSNASLAVVNPTSKFADLQFTLYGLDGNPVSSGLVNPVRYRVAPNGQFSMRANDIFAASKIDGWIQVTSSTTGLVGFYLADDLGATLEGSLSANALPDQVVPVVRDDQETKTELVIVNPAAENSTITVSLFNSNGEKTGTVLPQLIRGHGSLRLPTSALNGAGAGTLSARISASVPVAATAIVDRGGSLLYVSGQPVNENSSLRVAPQFISGGGYDSVLILTNPSASVVTVSVTLFPGASSQTGSVDAPGTARLAIPPGGSVTADARTILNRPLTPTVNGWVRVESDNGPLVGLVITNQGQAVTSVPLQAQPLTRGLYAQVLNTDAAVTSLAFVNPSESDAAVTVALLHDDGIAVAQAGFSIRAASKYTTLLQDLLPAAAADSNGYFVVAATAPVYSIATVASSNQALLASIPPVRLPDTFVPGAITIKPEIKAVDPSTDVQPGSSLRVTLGQLAGDPTFTLAGQPLTVRQVAPGSDVYTIDVPPIDQGFADLIAHSGNADSAPVTLHVVGRDSVPMQMISGRAFYQKIDVTDSGLDLNNPVMFPIRSARVEVFSASTQSIVAVSETDRHGRFNIPVPLDPSLTVRVISRLRSSGLRVLDNTNMNAPYIVSAEVDGRDSYSDLLLAEASRVAGAFNILEVVQRANDVIKLADPNIVPPAVTIFWSIRNTKKRGNPAQGLIGTSYFDPGNNRAFILGDRNVDSDEFDDSVIVHEYGHMLAAKFSRDDSPGGETHIGDMLDPRVSWSEGWANFFSAVVRNDSVWRDSNGPNGSNVYRFNIDDNLSRDNPGYWSESSVSGLLWDLYDDRPDSANSLRYPFSLIWSAFTDLTKDHFVYLPYFLEHLLDRNPPAPDALSTIVQSRSIHFQPNVRPSITNPFPSPLTPGSSVSGFVDSLTPRRNNLVTSSHFYAFTTTGGGASVRMDIVGLGPAGNLNANDLDMYLMDSTGRVLGRSNGGVSGQSELISARLQEGTYVVEIRSFRKAETGAFVFNSGQYRLSVTVQ